MTEKYDEYDDKIHKVSIRRNGEAVSQLDREVEVCAECLCASCWHGEFMCERAGAAGTVKRTVRELRALGREHPDNYSAKKVREVCGS